MPLNFVELPEQREQVGVPRNGRDQPLVIPLLGGKPKSLTRTTTFVDCIDDKSNLATWGKRMTLIGAGMNPGLAEAAVKLDATDKEDKRKLNALAEKAVTLAGAHEKSEKGTYLHTLSEYVDRGEALPPGPSEKDVADMAAYKFATVDFEVTRIEQFVVVPQVGCAGTLDRTLLYSGPGPINGEHIEGEFIGDLKTGTTEYGGLKMAAQLACYSRGLIYDWTKFPVDTYDPKAFEKWKKVVVAAEEAATAYSPLGEINQEWGIIINLPSGSGVCTLHWADLTIGWEAALLALEIRAMRTKGRKALRSFFSPECASVDFIEGEENESVE